MFQRHAPKSFTTALPPQDASVAVLAPLNWWEGIDRIGMLIYANNAGVSEVFCSLSCLKFRKADGKGLGFLQGLDLDLGWLLNAVLSSISIKSQI